MMLIKRNAGGLVFEVRPGTSDFKSVEEVVLRKGYQRKYFRIEPGEAWLDLGANIGAFSCFAISKGASVKSLEPEENNFNLLCRNLELNGFEADTTRAAVVAASEEKEVLRFYLSNTRYGQWRHSLYKSKNKSYIQVPAVNFEALIEGVDGVKMDIEGAEISILSECVDFKKVKKLCFEYHFDVNDSISKFNSVITLLGRHFSNIATPAMPEVERYNFYPPAVIVFCWNE